MKVTIVKEFRFESAHHLPGHPGKCRQYHGHSYKLQVGVEGEIGDGNDMVMDFSELKSIVNEQIVEEMDHKLLNDLSHLENFPCYRPTAELMVSWMVDRLYILLPGLKLVRLWETDTSFAEVILP